MSRLPFMVAFAVSSGLSVGGCAFDFTLDCEERGCSSDCPQSCPTTDDGGDPSTFVPPTPPESCPVDADRICADGYLYSCADGRVTSKFFSCRPGTTCVETVTSDGRRAAACAIGDDPCMSDAPASAECRGADRIACEYGLVIRRTPCPRTPCLVTATPDDYPIASCVLAN